MKTQPNKIKDSITETFVEWKEESRPYFSMRRDGTDELAKRFKVYEDEQIKICHVFEPTFYNEGENYISVYIKSIAIMLDVPIGGFITRDDAIKMAQRIVTKMLDK